MNRRRLMAVACAAALVGACGSDDTTGTAPATVTSEPTTDAPATTTAESAATTEPTATEASTTMTTEPATTTTEPTTTEPTTATGAPTDTTVEASCTPVTVDSGGTMLPGERCEPTDPPPDPIPAAIVLNGCGGYVSDDEITAATVRALAERGVVALRVDWLAAAPAPPDTYCQAGPVIAAVQPLLQGVVDAVASLRADAAVDGERIGTASYSLGALGALAADLGGAGLTTVDRLGLRAAALLSYPNQLPTITTAAEAGMLPPLFLMTGALDDVAPPADAQALADAATVGGIPNELVIVPDQPHPWRGEAALTAAAAMADFLAGALAT